MDKRLELYEIAIANAESDSDLNYIIEHASFDELLTDAELIKSKRQYDNFFDSWDVTYITANANGTLTLEVRG